MIDARGIATPVTCLAGSTPWISGATAVSTPATILLPAGTINVSTTWILPSNSRIVGQGPNSTIIKPTASFTANSTESPSIDAVIEMGTQDSATLNTFCRPSGTTGNADCVAVGVQDLTLNLSGVSVQYGIYNAASQELSFVDNVVFNGVGNATTPTHALEVTMATGPSSSNSGPYSNLVFNLASSVHSDTRCVDLLAHTRGLHGLSCNGGGTPTAGIYLDSDGNSIENVSINGFANGIYIGSQGQAPSNVLFNIAGGPNVTNLVHISSATASGTAICPGANNQNVCDLTLMNISAGVGTTIQDDLTPPAQTVSGGDATVAIYIVGEEVGSVATSPLQYTRFTTSPRVPTWGSGTVRPSGTCPSTGSLFSSLASGTGGNLFACIGS